MQWAPSRRRMLTTLSLATAAGLIGGARGMAQEAPPETTTIRLAKIPGICIAPQYVAEELLRSEGFTNVQYVEHSVNVYAGFTAGTIDISMAFIAPYIIQIDAGLPLVLLGGVHAGCFELFGTERIRAVRDLKGKMVAIPELGSAHHVFVAAMASHVGIDPKRDINFVIHPPAESMQLLADRKIDAFMGFPPDPQELREKKIGHVIVSSGLDRPWSQYFCCIVAAH
jgi:NitT/TauT family transport system substrate-binding protein